MRAAQARRRDAQLRSQYDAQLLITGPYRPADPWKFVMHNPEAFQGEFMMVAVIGLFNRGKTFVLNLLANLDLPASLYTHTLGLSFRRPVRDNNRSYFFIDTQGLDSPASLRTC